MRTCDYCGKPIAGKSTKRFCDSTCRMRSKSDPEGERVNSDAPDDGAGVLSTVPFADEVLAELSDVGRADTIAGRNAVLLARQLGSKMVNMSGLASLNKEFWRVYAQAMAGAEQKVPDAVDDLTARRDAKRRAG